LRKAALVVPTRSTPAWAVAALNSIKKKALRMGGL
jgi:hypothetical protein